MKKFIIINYQNQGVSSVGTNSIKWSASPDEFLLFDSYQDAWRIWYIWGWTSEQCQIIDLVEVEPEVEPGNTLTKDQAKAIKAWCNWFSKKVDRINYGYNEDYTGYEQDLFDSFGCQTY
jgi:hypothetical protein